MEFYATKDGKQLRRGITTGTCAAAAACGAAGLLLSRGEEQPCEIRIRTPKEIEVEIPVEKAELKNEEAICCVRKDSGDDPDVTNGVLVYATVKKLLHDPGEILIQGGEGIGTVTKPGLACPVGSPAINPVPRRMILEEVRKQAERFGYSGGLKVEISIPEGKKLAEKTFNPKLGILGGISVLGTSGIVEPMSEQAIIDTVKTEMNVAKAEGKDYLILTPGNYGEAFLQRTKEISGLAYVKCSNFIGDALDYAAETGFCGILLVGHIGKLIKVGAGQMNTHSKYGDGRMETLADCLEQAGGRGEILLSCVTTEEAIHLIRDENASLEEKLWAIVLEKIQRQMKERVKARIRTEAMIYSNRYGYLGETPGTGAFLTCAAAKEEKR